MSEGFAGGGVLRHTDRGLHRLFHRAVSRGLGLIPVAMQYHPLFVILISRRADA